MRFRILPLCLCSLAAMLFVAGCGRYDSSTFTAEIDEPNYRRGKDMIRQGRNQEALVSFQKVIEKRGDDAPESHLELGILYQQQPSFKDPIAAIYHYRKFLELKRNSPQADLVRQRVDAATREFARTLPAQPLDNQMERIDLLEKIDQLQRENALLKEQLIGVRTQAINTPRPAPGNTTVAAHANAGGGGAADPIATQPLEPAESPFANPVDEGSVVVDVPAQPTVPVPPTRPTQPTTVNPTAPPAQPSAGRRYVVQKGDSVFAIAKKHYGTASNARVQGILNANRGVLPNAGALQPGMTLVIP